MVINLISKVSRYEENIAALRAKSEATRRGESLLKRADEVHKQASQRKHDNLLCMGEIYGEKVVLATEAQELKFLRFHDGITMNRDRLLADAKSMALSLVHGYQPPTPPEFSLPGATARVALSMAVKALTLTGKATVYDAEISKELAFILTGGDTDITEKVSEDQFYELELEAFMTLIKNPKTLARIEYMLEMGKPLRN